MKAYATAPARIPARGALAGQSRAETGAASFLTLGPLSVSVHPEAGEWLAVEQRTSMYGEGDSPSEALLDLLLSLRELRGHLTEDDGRLPPELQAQLEALRASPL